MLMSDLQQKKIVQENDDTFLTFPELPEFQSIVRAHDFLEQHAARVRRILQVEWKSRDLEYKDVHVEDSTIVQFLTQLRDAVNTTAMLNREQQDFVFNLLDGHPFQKLSCDSVERHATVDYWDAVVPLAAYINTCKG
jgi:hypothetical protein